MAGRISAPVPAVVLGVLLAGCGVADGAESPAARSGTTSAAHSTPPSRPSVADRPEPPPRPALAPEPRRSWLSIPTLGLEGVPVVRYRGAPDDARGTRIQNRGPAASPRGPDGGVGPGGVGNYIVTGHRTSHAAPFRDLPALRPGDHVLVRAGDTVYDYVLTRTRRVSFRSERSMARQVAAVPGRPGEPARKPMITLSTCATPEDHAVGNYWSDRLGNPEHRIDKVGVLVEARPIRPGAG